MDIWYEYSIARKSFWRPQDVYWRSKIKQAVCYMFDRNVAVRWLYMESVWDTGVSQIDLARRI